MKDTDIIKALECCTDYSYESLLCRECPYFEYGFNRRCRDELSEDSLALINRQNAEIERLETENKNLLKKLCKKSQTASKAARKLIRSEAIKEFAERLKGNIRMNCFCEKYVFEKDIDNLVKEMVGGEE